MHHADTQIQFHEGLEITTNSKGLVPLRAAFRLSFFTKLGHPTKIELRTRRQSPWDSCHPQKAVVWVSVSQSDTSVDF